MDYRKEYERWLASEALKPSERQELAALDAAEAEDRFYRNLSFGTAGLRGVMALGPNRMNVYTVRLATEAFARVLLRGSKKAAAKGVCLCYDCRDNSLRFAREAARVLVRNGFFVRMFVGMASTPQLSFAVRRYGAAAGINITASHNTPGYNGYKAYNSYGSQIDNATADAVAAEMARLDPLSISSGLSFENGLECGQIVLMGEADRQAFVKAELGCAIDREVLRRGSDLRIVYTPLHGVGGEIIPYVLDGAGFRNIHYVREQMRPDGAFPTAKSPNPEDPASFALAVKLAREKGADLIIANDPDADRIGIFAPDSKGALLPVSGNLTGALLLNYIIEARRRCGSMPEKPAFIKTIVTGGLAACVAESAGVACYETFTGFRFMAEKVRELEKRSEGNYLLAYEESFGYMMGNHVRDKDGVSAALLLAEMCAWYRGRGMTLWDGAEELFRRHGYFAERTSNMYFPGVSGQQEMRRIMEALRRFPPKEICGHAVERVRDYLSGVSRGLALGERQELPISGMDVLIYELSGGSRLAVRPSGTEPKVKLYLTAVDLDQNKAKALLTGLAEAMNAYAPK